MTLTRSKPYYLLDNGGLSVYVLHAACTVTFLLYILYTFLYLFMNNWLYWLTVFYWILQQITGDLRNTKKNNNKRVRSQNISAAVKGWSALPSMIGPVTSVQPFQSPTYLDGVTQILSSPYLHKHSLCRGCFFVLFFAFREFFCFLFALPCFTFFYCVLNITVPSCLFSQLTLQPRNKAS